MGEAGSPARVRSRAPCFLALAIPVLAGASWMAFASAPSHYAPVNLAALVLASLWLTVGRTPTTVAGQSALLAVIMILPLLPLLTGPTVLSITQDPVARWLQLGPFALHTGMLATPALVVLAARMPDQAAPILLAGAVVALLQPDAATGFALTLAAVGLHHVTKDWKVGLAAIVAFVATLRMAVTGEIAPQPFVERVLVDAASLSLPMATALAIALAASFALLLWAVPFGRSERFALAGAFFGYVLMAMMTSYPMPLAGYGAGPILGFGFALGLHRIQAR